MDLYAYFWGVLKYLLPAMLLIVALWVEPNYLLLIISLIWILSSITVSVLYLDPKTYNGQKY
ncbi:MAG: hypothetical protein M1149_06240 [Candidatus Thermoplasmatota archaeon]|jgi:hypothetical protein|nr:hypothetical protein [Candidatus Thermoplasmatota archaeon]